MSISETNLPIERPWRASRPTLLVLKDGRGYVVTNYWIEGGQLVYLLGDGTQQVITLDELDFQMTSKLNRERGVTFALRSKVTEP